MKLFDIFYNYTNDELKKLIQLLNAFRKPARKEEMVSFLRDELLIPDKLRQHWARLDELSQKAVAAAYHNDGTFNANAFVNQYGALPERPKSDWYWAREPILWDLFVYNNQIPSDLMPLLAELVPPAERFQVTGLVETPTLFAGVDQSQPLLQADTEETGLHDLAIFLRLLDQHQLSISSSSYKLTAASAQRLLDHLLQGDFFPQTGKLELEETYRPFGLSMFAWNAGLASNFGGGTLTGTGKAFLQSQDLEILLEAFETWTNQGSFDELTRIDAIRGQKSKGLRLSKPGARRAAIVEALSWCPVNVWIPIQEFYRALIIWHFDFDLEEGHEAKLYVGYKREVNYRGWADRNSQWLLTKGLYVNAVLWEYLGTLGVLDLLYLHPEDAQFPAEAYYQEEEYYSRYDGLKYFRINNLGAYLLGQANTYEHRRPVDEPLFTIAPDLSIILRDPATLTPNLHHQLLQIAQDAGKGRYHLDTQLLLAALETGNDFDALTNFLTERNTGPLPAEVTAWLAQVQTNSRAFTRGAQAVFIKAHSAELVQQILADPALGKFCHAIDAKTFVVTANREKTLRNRLKEWGYGVL
ncbi:MAG: hypothetical protein NT075_35150 [Chloroflexi bacterium]|nr:hypothetical protein [Chloroflexota bacterium]